MKKQKMKHVWITDEIHQTAKIGSALAGMDLQDYIGEAIEEKAQKTVRKQLEKDNRI